MRRSIFTCVYLFFAAIAFALFILATTLLFGLAYALSFLIPIGKRRRESIMYSCMVLNARFVHLLLFVRVDGEGFETIRKLKTDSDARICLISNHTSMLDISTIILGCYPMRVGFIAKKSLFSIPVFRLYLKVAHCVPIDISSVRSNIEAIRRGVDSISAGMPMLIFPEGSRSKTGRIAPFKRGSFKMAERSGAVVVPIALSGLRDYAENRRRLFVRERGRAVVLDSVGFSGLRQDEADAAAKDIEERIRAAAGDK